MADLLQDVFTALLQKLPQFTYDSQKSFRAWLRTVTLNKWREQQRRHSIPIEEGDGEQLDGIANPDEAKAVWETEYRNSLLDRAMTVMKDHFQPQTWKACWELLTTEKSGPKWLGSSG